MNVKNYKAFERSKMKSPHIKTVHSVLYAAKVAIISRLTEPYETCLIIFLQLVRTCARYHQEQKKSEERSKKEKEIQLRHIASTIAREVEFFWSNIEQVRVLLCGFSSIYAIVTSPMTFFFSHQVVEMKLQFEIYEKRLKSLCIQKARGLCHSFKKN